MCISCDFVLYSGIAAQGPGGGFIPNTLRVNLGNNAVDDIVIPNPLIVGTWTHLALTFDYTADQYFLYLDGQEVASSMASRNAPTQAVRFGGVTSDFGQTFFFDGLLDEVTIYDRVLEPEEIQAIVQADSAGKCPDAADLDGDGVLNDLCPTSDLRSTVVLDSCDSGVTNPVLPSGCTLGDLIADCTVEAHHRRVMRCVRQLTKKLERLSIITEEQQDAIITCVEQTELP